MSVSAPQPGVPRHAPGVLYRLAMPAHAAVLQQEPLPFLNDALHAYGSLAPDNAIVGIEQIDMCDIGSTGQKLFLSVRYAKPDPTLPCELFAKFSRNFDDPFNDRRRDELESEIQFYELARDPAFPIAVPRSMFGDFEPLSGTGLLITERMAFGQPPIEPLRAKCMDHELDRPLEHYRAILDALATLAGSQRSGRLGPKADELFAFDRSAALTEDPIDRSEAELLELVDDFAALARDCPQLFPEHLRTPDVIARLRHCVIAVFRHELAIKLFLVSQDDLIALTHFNPNIDNAWFWRDDAGALRCGLFDWQRTRRMNLAYALWGGLCGGNLSMWEHDLDDLLTHFAQAYRNAGGPRLDPGELRLHMHLYSALMGVAGLLGAARLLRQRLPRISQARGPHDAMIVADERSRCFLHVFTILLAFLEMDGFSSSLLEVLAKLPTGGGGQSRR